MNLAMDSASLNRLTLQLLEWLAAQPRTYREAMDAWRSTCPRLSIWEDAITDGLIEVDGQGASSMHEAPVKLTPRGRGLLKKT